MIKFKYNHFNKTYIGSVSLVNGRKNMGTIQLDNGNMTKTLYRDIVRALSSNKVEYI